MQYRNACTNPHWLPSQAPLNKGDNNGAVREYMTQLTQSVVVPELAVVNGRSELSRYFGLGTASTDTHHQSSSAVAPIAAHDMLSNSKQVDTLNDLKCGPTTVSRFKLQVCYPTREAYVGRIGRYRSEEIH